MSFFNSPQFQLEMNQQPFMNDYERLKMYESVAVDM